MNWRNFFKTSHTLWLEQQIVNLKVEHAEQLTQLKSAHGRELAYAIKQADKLRDDLDRTRLLLTPALQSVRLASERDDSPPPIPTAVPVGTPWQKILAREIAAQEEQERIKEKKVAAANGVPVATTGGTNGDDSEGRHTAP